MKPFWQSGDRRLTVVHGDCRDVLPSLDTRGVLVLTDPPYGINERTARFSAGRSGREGSGYRGTKPEARDFPSVHGDDEPYDPSPLLGFPRLILFGGNHYADHLPPSASWLVWDKLAGLTSKRPIGFNDNGDAELIWTNLGGPVRIIPCRWMGILKDSELGQQRVHPTQKPILLMRWLIEMFARPDDLILDPYMGSGSTLVAAMSLGRRALGIEYSRDYCDIAVSRLQDPPLFELIEREPSPEQVGLFAEAAP